LLMLLKSMSELLVGNNSPLKNNHKEASHEKRVHLAL